MRNVKPNSGLRPELVTPEDITRLFGDVEAELILAILALRPTVADLEEVALRLAGDGESVGRRQAAGVVKGILDLVDTGDEEDRAPAGSKNTI